MKQVRVEDVPVVKHTAFTHPESYDCSSLCQPPVNQGSCGSCWAIAAVQCAADRMGGGVKLSHRHLNDCADNCVTWRGRLGCSQDCEGGFLTAAFEYMRRHGVVSESKYRRGQCADRAARWKIDGFYILHQHPDLYGVTNARKRPSRMPGPAALATTVRSVCEDIYLHGPVAACMNMYSDFIPFSRTARPGAVYRVGWQGDRSADDQVGDVRWSKSNPGPAGVHFVTGHAVSIMGWGTAPDGTPYWIIRNSWGGRTGRGGYLKMLRGHNCSGIESDVEAPVVQGGMMPQQQSFITSSQLTPLVLVLAVLVIVVVLIVTTV